MDCLIDQGTAALGGKPAAPGAVRIISGISVPGYDAAGAQNLPCFAGNENVTGFPDAGVVAVLITQAKPGTGIVDCIFQAVKLFL